MAAASTSMSPIASPPGTATGVFKLSLVAPEEPQDLMKVYNPAQAAALATAADHPSLTSSSVGRQPRVRASSAASAEDLRRTEHRALHRERLCYKQEQALQKTLSRHRHGREKKREEEHAQFEGLYERLVTEEHSFVADVKDFLKTQARHDVRKREELHREWDDQIYQKVPYLPPTAPYLPPTPPYLPPTAPYLPPTAPYLPPTAP